MTLAFEHKRSRTLLVIGDSRIRISRYCESKGKRLFDFVTSLISLIVLFPFLFAVFTAVKVTSPGPAFYGHIRTGKNAQTFKCWKFRTMVVDAQERLDELLKDPKVAAEWADTQKLKYDPRVTSIGHVLRKLSIDEFPQLWNILIGEMSVVGPRPVTEKELSRYGADVGYYLSTTPGLTGPWQVGGRSNTTYEERVELDKSYSITANFWGDLVLIIRTVGVLFGDRNAR